MSDEGIGSGLEDVVIEFDHNGNLVYFRKYRPRIIIPPESDGAYYNNISIFEEKSPIQWAKETRHYFDDITDVIDWLTNAPLDAPEPVVIATFSTFDEYKQLIEATSSYEIALDYVVPGSTMPHAHAGIGGLTTADKGEATLFFTVYGHSSEGNNLTSRRVHRVFSNETDIAQILKDIGIIRGEGYLVITKGNEKSVNPKLWKFPSAYKDKVFDMHTHPKGVLNYIPSTETNNAANNPKGGDYQHLERQQENRGYGTVPPSEEPAYLSLDESPPNVAFLKRIVRYVEEYKLRKMLDEVVPNTGINKETSFKVYITNPIIVCEG